MAHVNHFLRDVGLRNRRRFKESIIAVRVGGATPDGYRDYMNHLRGQERVARQQAGQKEGRRFMSYEETLKLESQRHVKFNEMSQAEKDALTTERESLWSQIPAHIVQKSRKLAGR